MNTQTAASRHPAAAAFSTSANQPTSRDRAATLLARARTLRDQSTQVNPVLATAYRRRSAELSLEAWLLNIHGTPTDIDTFTTLAA